MGHAKGGGATSSQLSALREDVAHLKVQLGTLVPLLQGVTQEMTLLRQDVMQQIAHLRRGGPLSGSAGGQDGSRASQAGLAGSASGSSAKGVADAEARSHLVEREMVKLLVTKWNQDSVRRAYVIRRAMPVVGMDGSGLARMQELIGDRVQVTKEVYTMFVALSGFKVQAFAPRLMKHSAGDGPKPSEREVPTAGRFAALTSGLDVVLKGGLEGFAGKATAASFLVPFAEMSDELYTYAATHPVMFAEEHKENTTRILENAIDQDLNSIMAAVGDAAATLKQQFSAGPPSVTHGAQIPTVKTPSFPRTKRATNRVDGMHQCLELSLHLARMAGEGLSRQPHVRSGVAGGSNKRKFGQSGTTGRSRVSRPTNCPSNACRYNWRNQPCLAKQTRGWCKFKHINPD